MRTTALLAALASAASAAKLGFNYGSTFTTGAPKAQADFEAEFTTAANLKGTKGWTSARLYSMIVSYILCLSWSQLSICVLNLTGQ